MSNNAAVNQPETFDLLRSPDVQSPFEFAAWLREKHPVYWNEQYQVWMLSRYRDVKDALLAPHKFSSRWTEPFERRRDRLPQEAHADFDDGVKFFYGHFHASDPPAHTGQRQATMKVFMPLVTGVVRASLDRRVNNLLDNMERAGTCDFIKEFAYPLPAGVIFDLLGIPDEYHQVISEVSESYADFPNAVYAGDCKALAMIADRTRRAKSALMQLIQLRRQDPQEDLISALVRAESGMEQLPDEDIVHLSCFLLIAGHETTVSLLGGSMRYLLQDRRQWERLLAEPELLPGAVEELLRFVSPLLWVGRVVAENIELHGKLLRKGSGVLLGMGAANHDPNEYSSPEILDVSRKNVLSLAFGYGIHTCLGAALTRLEAQVALSQLLQRFPNIEMRTDRFEYHPSFFLRNLKSLPLAVS
jgi:cytochrome P450